MEWAERIKASHKAQKLCKIIRLRRNRNYGTWAPSDNSKYTQASRIQASRIINWTHFKLLMMQTTTNPMEAQEEASLLLTTTWNSKTLLTELKTVGITPKWPTAIFKRWRINTEITIEAYINLKIKTID